MSERRFQFTHPGKGATQAGLVAKMTLSVSIHAPWEGCDGASRSICPLSIKFQFTHPGKGATFSKETNLSFALVSIHAPWEGCDSFLPASFLVTRCFNSRTLGRVRLISRGS